MRVSSRRWFVLVGCMCADCHVDQATTASQLAEVLHLAANRGCLSSGVSAEVTNSPSDSTQHFMPSLLLLVWLCGGGGCRGLDWEASLKELWRALCSQPDLGTLASSKQKAIVPRLIVFISSQYHAAQGEPAAQRLAHVSMLQSQRQERLSCTPSTANKRAELTLHHHWTSYSITASANSFLAFTRPLDSGCFISAVPTLP